MAGDGWGKVTLTFQPTLSVIVQCELHCSLVMSVRLCGASVSLRAGPSYGRYLQCTRGCGGSAGDGWGWLAGWLGMAGDGRSPPSL